MKLLVLISYVFFTIAATAPSCKSNSTSSGKAQNSRTVQNTQLCERSIKSLGCNSDTTGLPKNGLALCEAVVSGTLSAVSSNQQSFDQFVSKANDFFSCIDDNGYCSALQVERVNIRAQCGGNPGVYDPEVIEVCKAYATNEQCVAANGRNYESIVEHCIESAGWPFVENTDQWIKIQSARQACLAGRNYCGITNPLDKSAALKNCVLLSAGYGETIAEICEKRIAFDQCIPRNDARFASLVLDCKNSYGSGNFESDFFIQGELSYMRCLERKDVCSITDEFNRNFAKTQCKVKS